MTEQPKPGGDETPNGYQPPSYIPPQDSDAPRPPVPPASSQFQQPESQGSRPYGQPNEQYGQSPYGQYGQPPSPYAQQYGQPPSPYGTTYGQPGYYGTPAPKGLSIASLCCGIAVFVGFGFFILPQIAAVILGHMALQREPAGKGMAIAGLALGYVGIALTVIVIIFFVIAMQVAVTNPSFRN
jgi:hypothetical protein